MNEELLHLLGGGILRSDSLKHDVESLIWYDGSLDHGENIIHRSIDSPMNGTILCHFGTTKPAARRSISKTPKLFLRHIHDG